MLRDERATKPQGKKTSAHKGDGEFGPNSSLLAPYRPLTGMLVARASIRPKFDSSRDLRLLFGQPLAENVTEKEARPKVDCSSRRGNQLTPVFEARPKLCFQFYSSGP